MSYPKDALHRILFLDIETAAQHPSLDHASDLVYQLWAHKAQLISGSTEILSPEDIAHWYLQKAAIYAEFGKVVCISVGYLHEDDEGLKMKIKSFSSHDEKQLLADLCILLGEHYYDRYNHFVAGHNIKEFDVPYLCRRLLINGMRLPNLFQVAGYKPWQVHHLLDTMDVWKFGDYKHYTSLALLSEVLDIPTPKDDISGKDVSRLYWSGELERITRYCEKDVLATARVYLRCLSLEDLDESRVEFV